MRRSLFVALVLTVLTTLTVSCFVTTSGDADEKPLPVPENTTSDVTEVEQEVKGVEESLAANANDQAQVNTGIRTQATVIEKKDPKKVHAQPIAKIRKLTGKSDEVVKDIKKSISTLQKTQTELANVRSKVVKLEDGIKERDNLLLKKSGEMSAKNKEIEKLKKSLEEENKKNKSLVNKLMMVLLGIGLLSVALAGYMAATSPNKRVIGFAAGGVVLIISSLTVMFYLEKLAFIGVISFVVILGFVAYIAYKHFNAVGEGKKNEEALEGAVRVAEMLKGEVDIEKREEIFGRKHDNGRAGSVQTREAMTRIRKIRAKIHEEDKPTIF